MRGRKDVQSIHKAWNVITLDTTTDSEAISHLRAAAVAPAAVVDLSTTSGAWENYVLQMRDHFSKKSFLLFSSADGTNFDVPYIPVRLTTEDLEDVSLTGLVNSNRRRVVLEGLAGSGKSTLLREIFRLWLGKKAFVQFQLILPIDLALLSRLKKWSEEIVILNVCKVPKVLFNAIVNKHVRVLFVFDGLDEATFTEEFSKEFLEPLFTNQLDWIGDAIITTRPGFVKDGVSFPKILLMGFDESRKEQYIDHFFQRKHLRNATKSSLS